eukprot:TRINITY_DN982_c0_g1_i1.p1 TRINITY_DN982_c0_g1~~TRINITY_DN982_c0_g1_i1.p1  ORF type:complete len:554 (-),score=135.90 TRINITY_DN982_c0_g1_i1:115-1776(-)
MGIRMKFQSKATAQLVLEAHHVSDAPDVAADAEAALQKERVHEPIPDEPMKPHDTDAGVGQIGLHDENLMEKPTHLQRDMKALTAVQQAVLLALCVDVKNNNPAYGLTTEEMIPYLDRVAANPHTHAIHSVCLLLRSRLEMTRSKTVERATLQIQTLTDQYKFGTPDAGDRARLIYAVPWPSRRDLQRELADDMLNIGAAATALDLYEMLDLWEKVADCYVVMGKHERAERVVREQLSLNPTPRLHCILGELTEDAECYERAWDLSGHHFAMAKRLLGHHYLKRCEYALAVQHYKQALEINYLYPKAWFSLGCCQMRLERWDDALVSFTKCVFQEPEDGESYNNIASCYITLGKKPEAYRAMQEALKWKYDHIGMWQNFMTISIELGEFQQAMHAMTRVLEVSGTQVDLDVLRVLVGAYSSDLVFPSDGDRLAYGRLLTQLFTTITAAVANNADVWKLHADFLAAQGLKAECLESRLKECRSAQRGGWESDDSLFQPAAESACRLAEAYRAIGDAKSIFSAKTYLRNMMKKTEELFSTTPRWKQLQECLASFQ